MGKKTPPQDNKYESSDNFQRVYVLPKCDHVDTWKSYTFEYLSNIFRSQTRPNRNDSICF